MNRSDSRKAIFTFFVVILTALFGLPNLLGGGSVQAQSNQLEVTIITWDVIGLDSNDVNSGPNTFPVGVHVCSTGGASDGDVLVDFSWITTSTYINLKPGTLGLPPYDPVNIGPLAADECMDVYFEIEVTRNAAAYDETASYEIVVSDNNETVTSEERELLVEYLVSQNRNSTNDVLYALDGDPLVSVAPGGSLVLLVGETYDIQLQGGTATQGYEQLESFLTLTNTVFQINTVTTTFNADTAPYIASPIDQLYLDACTWDADPDSPNFRACLGVGKAGGSDVKVTYNVTILSGGGTTETLNSLLYDFSGSSYHYNSDFSTDARFAIIIDPSTATIAKEFLPSSIGDGGVSTMLITLGNPNGAALSDYNFTDNFPAGMTIANPTNASTVGCGTPTFSPVAGATSISFSNGTVAANGSCVISVNVTAPYSVDPTNYPNTTNNLFVGTVDTGNKATDTLNVTSSPPAPTPVCGASLATWTFPDSFSLTTPAAATSSVTASASLGAGMAATGSPSVGTDHLGTAGSNSWRVDAITDDTPAGLVTGNNEYYQFSLDTTDFSSVTLSFWAERSTQGAKNIMLYYGPTGTEFTAGPYNLLNQATWYNFSTGALTSGLGSTTLFRLYVYDSGNNNGGHWIQIDDISFTGCAIPQPLTITKSFSPDPVAVGQTSTLTFTITNPNTSEGYNNVNFTDVLPSNLSVVGGTFVKGANCVGGIWQESPAGTLALSGTSIAGSTTCTLTVGVQGSTSGSYTNVSGFISGSTATNAETVTNYTSTGFATDSLTVIANPLIDKLFSPNPILEGGISTLTFTITNPNLNNSITNVAFSDTFPSGLVVAPTPNVVNSCGGAFTATAGTGSVSLASSPAVTILAGESCDISVDVTAASANSYPNTTGAVTHLVNGAPFGADTANDTLLVNVPNPAIAILKQVGLSPTGPWFDYLSIPVGTPVFYQITIENAGDVALNNVVVTDNLYNLGALGCTFVSSLPVADIFDDDHIDTCVFTPGNSVAGTTINTANVNATYSGNPISADADSATYASASLAMVKLASPTTYTTAGEVIGYQFTVTNNGSAILAGPVTINDDKATDESCPALSTVGNFDNFFDPSEVLVCTATYTTTVADVNATFVTNIASASAPTSNAQGSPVITSLTDTETVIVPGTPALTLDKVGVLNDGGDGVANVGDSIAYSLTVTNTGNVTLTNVAVTDPLPGLSAITCASGNNPILSLAVGANEICTATYTLLQSDIDNGSVDNTATADSDQTTPVPDSASVPLPPVPALTLDKVGVLNDGGDGIANAGDSIAYSLTVTNTGNITLTNIAVTDPLPGLSAITCASGNNPILSLAVGANEICTATYTLLQSDIDNGSVDNTASADSDQTTPVPDSASVSLPPVPALTLDKVGVLNDGGDGIANVGDSIAYSLTVTNTGNITLTNIAITDPLPGLSAISCASGNNPILSLAVGANEICTATYTLLQSDIDTGSVDNTASADSDQTTPVQDNASVPLPAAPALTLDKVGVLNDGGDGIANAGDSIAYSLTVTNTGNITLTNIAVTDPLPGLSAITCASGNNPILSLAVGASEICTASYTLLQSDIDNGSVDNTASADSDQTTPVPDSANVPLPAVPALTLDKVGVLNDGGDGVANVGDSIAYSLTVTNTGNITLTNIAVTDPLPGLSAISCASGNNPILSLAVGVNEICTATYTLLQSDIDNGSVDNTASADSDQTTPVPDSASVTLPPVPALTLDKVGVLNDGGDGVANAGDSIAYSLTVTNTGNITLTNIAVTDPLPGLSAISCASGNNPILSLAVGVNEICTATYTLLQSDIDNGSVDNTASADSDQTTPVPDSANVPLPAAPALTLDKVGVLNDGGDGIANVGDSIAYSLTVTNTGNITLTNIAITDPLPGLSAITCASGNNPILNLAVGANEICTATYTLLQSDIDNGSVDNTASADSDQTTPVPDSASVSLPPVPALTLDKVGVLNDGGDGIANAGDSIAYSLTVTNTGNITLTNIAVTDPLPGLSAITCASGNNPILSLAVGVNEVCTATYTLLQSDIDNGSVDNTASADSDQTTPVQDNASVPLPAAPALTLDKVGVLNDGGDGVANVGDSIAYSLTVTNTGNVTLTNVAVTDPLPGLSAISCASGNNPILSLAVGVNEICTATYTLLQSDIDNGSVDNTASADSDQTTPVPDSASVPLPPVPALTLDKVGVLNDGGDGVANAGDSIAYSLTVTNTGNVTLTNVVVTDPLPGLSAITCASGNNPILSLAVGVNEICTATYTLLQSDIDNGSVDNTATADSDQTTPVQDNASVPLPAAPALTLDKVGVLNDGGDGVANAGDSIAYSLTVTNTGNITLTNIAVTDPLPGLSAITCASGNNPILSLAVGANEICTATYTLLQSDIDNGSVDNTASADSDQTTPVPDSANVPLPAVPALTLDKVGVLNDGGDGIANAGDSIAYSLTVTNTGNVTLTNVAVTDPLPGLSAITCASGSNPILSLAVGANEICTATYTLLQSDIDNGSVDNTASADSDQTTPVQDNASVPLPAAPALTLDKVGVLNDGGDGIANAGDSIAYSLTVTNTGNITLTNIAVTDPLPGLSAISCASGNNPILSLAVGVNEICTATYTLLQSDIDNGSVDNTASADSDQTTPVPDSANVPLPAVPALTLDKVGVLNDGGDGVANVGDSIAYSLTVTNTGNVTLTNVAVTDPLPGLSAITCASGNNPILSLAVGANEICTATYTLLQSDIDNGSVDNTASADSDQTTPVPDSANVPLPAVPALTLDKVGVLNDGGDGVANVGDSIAYSLTVTNTGNITLTNIAVTDPLPGLSAISCPSGNNPILSLAVGVNEICTATYTLLQSDIDNGSVDNTATADSDQTTPVPDSATVPLTQIVQIGVAKSASATTDLGGGLYDVTLTFVVENLGNIDLTNVQVVDDLTATFGAPATFSIQVAPNATGTLSANASYDGSGQINLLNAGTSTLAIGASESITVTVRFNPNGLVGPFFNTATASGDGGGTPTTDTSDDGSDPDPDTDGNPDEAGENDSTPITLTLTPNLNVTKSNNVGGRVTVGGSFNWILAINNSGTGAADFAAADVILVDDLPATGLSYGTINVSNTGGTTGTITCVEAAFTVTCTATTAVSIPVTGGFTMTIPVTGNTVGSYTNPTATCMVDPNNLIAESSEADNTCSNTVRVRAIPVTPTEEPTALSPIIILFDPAISKIGFLNENELGLQNEQITWYVTVINNGTATGTNIVVSDILRPELRVDAVNANPPLVVNINGQTITVTIPSLAPGQSVNFEIVTTVINGGAEIDNTACLTADNLDGQRCATAPVIAALPQTGETPWWMNLLLTITAVFTLALLATVGMKLRRHFSQQR